MFVHMYLCLYLACVYLCIPYKVQICMHIHTYICRYVLHIFAYMYIYSLSLASDAHIHIVCA